MSLKQKKYIITNCCMSKKSWPTLYSNLLNEMGKDFFGQAVLRNEINGKNILFISLYKMVIMSFGEKKSDLGLLSI